MNEENIAIRLKLLIEALGVSNSQFADECNISRPTLSQLLTGRNKKVSDVIIRQIHDTFPQVSVLWLLFGEGEMWVDSYVATGSTEVKPAIETSEKETVSDESVSWGVMDDVFDENASEISENPISVSGDVKNSKESGLNFHDNAIKSIDSNTLMSVLKSREFLDHIDKLRIKQRKVVSVTIYYDDSTFETFYPGK